MEKFLKQLSFPVKNSLGSLLEIVGFDYKTPHFSPTWTKTGMIGTIFDYGDIDDSYFCQYYDRNSCCCLSVYADETSDVNGKVIDFNVAIIYVNNVDPRNAKDEIRHISVNILPELTRKIEENFASVRVATSGRDKGNNVSSVVSSETKNQLVAQFEQYATKVAQLAQDLQKLTEELRVIKNG